MRTVLAVVLAILVLAGCSTEDPQPDPSVADAADVGWNPCDELTAREVARVVGEPLTMETGTTDEPRCTFVPVEEGGPAYDVSYLFFDGGLDSALEVMGTAGTRLDPVEVPGADAARLAVRERPSGILVTGFVQTDGLVQSVNAVRLKPYDRDAFVTSTTDLLGVLAGNAPGE